MLWEQALNKLKSGVKSHVDGFGGTLAESAGSIIEWRYIIRYIDAAYFTVRSFSKNKKVIDDLIISAKIDHITLVRNTFYPNCSGCIIHAIYLLESSYRAFNG